MMMDFDEEASMPTVLLIDDEQFTHELMNEALSGSCCLVSVGDGEDALMATHQWRPDLIIVDVEMPGIDGYETCRRLKSNPELEEVPLMFLSGHNQIEDRLKGYEAGGDDYVTKPFNLVEIKTKVMSLLNLVEERKELKSRVDFATHAAMTVMSNMSELGALLESLKKFNSCTNCQQLAETVMHGVQDFDLQGVVLIRTPGVHFTWTGVGAASPLEISVIEHMASMERIVQFKSRMAINYDHVSLLISNMPVDDEARCGRLRDHLAMLVEGAEGRAQGIIAVELSEQRGAAIAQTLEHITETLKEIDFSQRQSHLRANTAVVNMNETISTALLSIGLTDKQEEYFVQIIKNGVDSILDSQSDEVDVQNKLSNIIKGLKETLGA